MTVSLVQAPHPEHAHSVVRNDDPFRRVHANVNDARPVAGEQSGRPRWHHWVPEAHQPVIGPGGKHVKASTVQLAVVETSDPPRQLKDIGFQLASEVSDDDRGTRVSTDRHHGAVALEIAKTQDPVAVDTRLVGDRYILRVLEGPSLHARTFIMSQPQGQGAGRIDMRRPGSGQIKEGCDSVQVGKV